MESWKENIVYGSKIIRLFGENEKRGLTNYTYQTLNQVKAGEGKKAKTEMWAEEKKKELIGDLKFASKDIITALRETVWALKKENYTAEDCLLRIRNFIQPFSRYYSHINFRIEGEAPAGMELHYTKALNLVRIVQESVSNSIKHANPKNITVSSYLLENKWKLIVSDDGNGFDYPTMKKKEQGNGLKNMEHRAAESAFEFNMKTSKQSGTQIIIIT